MTQYAKPGSDGSLMTYKDRYDNFIGGQWVPPVGGEYFDDPSPVDGQVFTQVARSSEGDVEKALDAAWKAAETWNRTTVAERAIVLNKIADRMEQRTALLIDPMLATGNSSVAAIDMLKERGAGHIRVFGGGGGTMAGVVGAGATGGTRGGLLSAG